MRPVELAIMSRAFSDGIDTREDRRARCSSFVSPLANLKDSSCSKQLKESQGNPIKFLLGVDRNFKSR